MVNLLYFVAFILCFFVTEATTPTSEQLSGQWQGNMYVGQVSMPGPTEPTSPVTVVPSVTSPKTSRRIDHMARPDPQPLISTIMNVTAQLGSHGRRIFEDVFGKMVGPDDARRERISQMNQWMSNKDMAGPAHPPADRRSDGAPKPPQPLVLSPLFGGNDPKLGGGFQGPKAVPYQSNADETRDIQDGDSGRDTRRRYQAPSQDVRDRDRDPVDQEPGDLDNLPDEEPMGGGLSGTAKTPPCAHNGRFYCSFKEDYPVKVVTEVTRYYKWPLEKLFRDLRSQVMPKLANDNHGGLVCDSVTRVVRPGWARNTNNRWLVVINNDAYQQFVTEVICRNGPQAPCNFIPPCYSATCSQRYNTQKLLVIDPWNPYKGPFVSEFLFPSCCICYVPSYSNSDPVKPDQSPAGDAYPDHGRSRDL